MMSTDDLGERKRSDEEGLPPGRTALQEMGRWLFGALMGFLAFVGLLLASRATDPIFEWFGLLLFAFGVLFIFGMVYRYIGRSEGE